MVSAQNLCDKFDVLHMQNLILEFFLKKTVPKKLYCILWYSAPNEFDNWDAIVSEIRFESQIPVSTGGIGLLPSYMRCSYLIH